MKVAHDESVISSQVAKPPSPGDVNSRADSHATLANHQIPEASTNQNSLDVFLSEVRTTIALDATAEAQLRKELLASRQEEWPLVVKQFRAALNYRQELLARETGQLNAPSSQRSNDQLPLVHDPTTNRVGLSPASMPLERLRAELAQERQVQLASHQLPQESSNALASDELPIRGTTLANHKVVSSTDSPTSAVQLGVHTTAIDSENYSWRELLTQAIAEMQQEVKPLPGSTEELHQHMRLRMLLLTAGREEDSLEPIPGSSASEQDYWAKQIFAISALLDSQRQPDIKQRAAGSLVHLDQARAKLGELASLQVRNLTFADKVDGYGLYEPHVETKFQPGDKVTLYTEVENFRSESTKKGFRTSLATSYEVVDPQGRRVDGAQFPDVEDICRNLRHDFHMQYGLSLPTRIYPGSYELRLTITDLLSNKIGHASIPFEIIE